MKRKFIIVFAIAISIVCVIGYLARYTLSDITEHHITHEKVLISVVFPELSEHELKLSDEQACLLYERILEGRRVGGWYSVLSDDTGQHWDIGGEMYIVPKWCDKTMLWPVAWLTRNRMSVFYDPFNEVLVLSDWSIETDWDCYEGVVVSNVPPAWLNVDVDELRRTRMARCHSWKYRGKRNVDDCQDQSEHTPNSKSTEPGAGL